MEAAYEALRAEHSALPPLTVAASDKTHASKIAKYGKEAVANGAGSDD